MKSAGTVLVTYPAYWAFALPTVKDKQRSAHADMSVVPNALVTSLRGELCHDDLACINISMNIYDCFIV